MSTKHYYVTYKVEGMGEHRAGPYEGLREANAQLEDIAGYAGVYGAKVVEQTRFDHID